MANKVFIATSLDGFIADENGGIDWLTTMPNPTEGDAGFSKFMDGIDALVMGRNTFEKVLGFDIPWPYSKKVFVLSNSIKSVDAKLAEKVVVVRDGPKEIVRNLNSQGFTNLYIDGGRVIQSFLREGLIDEMIITQAPIILGRGIPLFSDLPRVRLEHQSTTAFDNGMVQSHYRVKFK